MADLREVLDPEAVLTAIRRLRDAEELPVKKVVAVDLDGVLADYSQGWKGVDHIGEPIDGAREFMAELREFATVLVFTSRTRQNPDGRSTPGYLADDDRRPGDELKALVTAWLDRHGIPYDDVWAGAGKPIAAALVDDRAVACQPQKYGREDFPLAIERCQELCGAVREFMREKNPAGPKEAGPVVRR